MPEPLELNLLDDTAWVSVIPLQLNVHLRDVIPVPGTSQFTELNVRTYVTHQGVPGVYLSIDASSRLASAVARSCHAVSQRDDADVRFEATVDATEMPSSNGVTALGPEPIMGYSTGSTSRCWPVRSAVVPQRIWPRI